MVEPSGRGDNWNEESIKIIDLCRDLLRLGCGVKRKDKKGARRAREASRSLLQRAFAIAYLRDIARAHLLPRRRLDTTPR